MINYQIIDDSIKHYEEYGFKRIEAPWTVTKEISDITKPKDAGDFTIKEKNKVLVASGEQSFLYLFNKGFLPDDGLWQCCTPCFREESFTPYHSKYFIKNELISTGKYSTKIHLEQMMDYSMKFYSKYIPKEHLKIVANIGDGNSEVTYDIVCDDIELGSYGIRYCPFLNWVYGTGLAEPRFSRVLKNIK